MRFEFRSVREYFFGNVSHVWMRRSKSFGSVVLESIGVKSSCIACSLFVVEHDERHDTWPKLCSGVESLQEDLRQCVQRNH